MRLLQYTTTLFLVTAFGCDITINTEKDTENNELEESEQAEHEETEQNPPNVAKNTPKGAELRPNSERS